MEEQNPNKKGLVEDVKDYIQTRVDLVKLQAAEKGSQAAGNAVAGVILFVCVWFGIMFLSFTIAFALGDALDRTWAGFLIVTLIYLIAGFIVYKVKDNSIVKPVANGIIKQMFKDRTAENHETESRKSG